MCLQSKQNTIQFTLWITLNMMQATQDSEHVKWLNPNLYTPHPSPVVHFAVSGADGTGVNARSWVNAAKMGMRQAAAPQEKARPCTFQHIVTINKVKGKFTSWHPLYTQFFVFVCVLDV